MEEVQIINLTGSEITYQQDKAQIDVQIATAKAYPRNIKRSVDNSIAIATMDMQTAESCTYAVPRGGKKITGASVNLAKIIAQNWGNLRIEAKVIDVDQKNVTSQAIAFDLETNIAIKVEVKRSIMTKTGRMSDDMIVVTGNAANSIALRNAIFNIIPKSVTDKVYGEAIKAITGDISDETKLIKRRKQVVDGLMATYKVTEAEILSSIGKSSLDHIGKEEIAVLIGIGTAIKEGDTTIDEAFRGKNTSKPEPKSKEKSESDRLIALINSCSNVDDLGAFEVDVDALNDAEVRAVYIERYEALKGSDGKA
jgi:hypothetical protein